MASLTDGLADGTACFEYVDTTETPSFSLPFASISSAFSGSRPKKTSLFFAWRHWGAGQSRQSTSSQAFKVEHFTVRRVVKDGRSLFRALALGIALNKGQDLNATDEKEKAGLLRSAVMGAICESDKENTLDEEAVNGIKVEESLERYCQIPRSNFRGGESELKSCGEIFGYKSQICESELKVLSKKLWLPLIVYEPSEAKQGGYIRKAEYGDEYTKPSKLWKARKRVRLLERLLDNGINHYDLIII